MSFLNKIKISRRLNIIALTALVGLGLLMGLAVMRLNVTRTDSFKSATQQSVDIAYSILDRYYNEEKSGRMTREQAQQAALESIRTLRFGKDDYFFVIGDDVVIRMHPVRTDLVGKNVAGVNDADGKPLFSRIVDLAKRDGQGFIEYNWQRASGSGADMKLSFIRHFAPWGMTLGTGVLFDQIRAAVMQDAFNLGSIAIVFVVIVAAVIWVISRSITQPVQALEGRMRSLADGDTGTPIPGLDGRDEVAGMAAAVEVFREGAVARIAAEAAKAQADADQAFIVSLVSHKLSNLAEGDLTARIDEQVPPSYDDLKHNYNGAIEKLRDLIGVISNASENIRTGSTEIAAASDDLARRTESNAASLEQTSAALSQIDNRLRSSAHSAGRTADRAREALSIVGTGRERANQASGAMTRVSESAKGIDTVIEGVDKIAFQTRVLAMNAAVEAGRAGEAGRGFAVVADLVSALAMRAEEEAKRAREQLTLTQADIVVAVDAVHNVDNALAEITSSVEEVSGLVSTMADDNRAQSSTISEIASAVNTMDQSTQQNAAMVEQTSAAARHLSEEVAILASRSGQFRTGNEPAARLSAPAAPAPRPAAKPARLAKAAAPAYQSPVKPLPVNGSAVAAGGDDWTSF